MAYRPLLVLAGDSWFALPGGSVNSEIFPRNPPNDFKEALKERGYKVKSVASKGDDLDDLLSQQADEMKEALANAGTKGRLPEAILLSVGAHDVLKSLREGGLLNEYASHAELGIIDAEVLRQTMNQISRKYEALFRAIDDAVGEFFSWAPRQVPVLGHGYSYHVPNGQGRTGALERVFKKGGPWLKPIFEKQGYPTDGEHHLVSNTETLATLTDAFNDTLAAVVQKLTNQLEEIRPHHLDFRSCFVRRARLKDYVQRGRYQVDWSDEIHLSYPAIKRAVSKMVTEDFRVLAIPEP